MGRRQPDMQRDDSCLDPESHEEEKEGRRALRQRKLGSNVVKVFKAETAAGVKEKQKTQDQTANTDVRHDEIQHAGPPCFRVLMLKNHQHKGKQGHQLPGNEQEDRVISAKEERRDEQ